jgi:cytochrome c oxidase cbb3-type subunit 2
MPAPRNFTTGVYRFKTTPGGEAPTDQDLFRTVSLGLHSTGMPPWKFLLPEEDRWAVVEYIKTFHDEFDNSDVTPVELGPEPKSFSEADIENGKKIYGIAQCAKCHGELGYGDGPSSLELVDTFGKPIPPRNFHKLPHYKRGYTVRDIALTISTGNNGTPMPAFGEAFEAPDIWDLAAYVQSLGERRLSGGGEKATAHAGAELGEPAVVVKLAERSWKFVPDVIRVRQGQVVRIDFQPTDNGLGAGHGFAVDGYDRGVFINGAMVQRPKSVTFLADKAGEFRFYCASQCSTGSLHPNMVGTLVVESESGGE